MDNIDLKAYSDQLEDELGSLFANTDKEQEINLDEMVEYYFDRPVEFAEDILNFKADKHQAKIMKAVLKSKRTAVKSGQGVGKTATVAIIVLWYLFTRYKPYVVATSPSMNQLFTVLWAEVGRWIEGTMLEGYFEHTKTKVQLKGHEMTAFAIAKTASTKEGMAGSHAENMLIICDEASGIDDEILETLEATISGKDNKLVYISNPTKVNGAFFDCFHINKKFWNCITVNAEEVERVNEENIQAILEKFGSREHPVYLVRVRGEFPEGNENAIIPRALAISRIGIKANYKLEDINLYGVDIARKGNDFTECYKDNDGTPRELFRYSHKDTMQTVGAIANECQKEPSKRHVVLIDGVGVGGGVVDRLDEMIQEDYAGKDNKNYQPKVPNLEIIEINNGSSVVFDPKNFGNVVAEMFFQAKEGLENNEIGMEDDAELIEDLTIREIAFKSDGKIIVEKKDLFKKKVGRSPDKGDGWLYCIYARNFI